MLELLTDPHAWAALVTLTALEIVLGIDNVVFISILVSRCSPEKARQARQIGLSLALIFRIVMLFGLTWLMHLTYPLVAVFGIDVSWRDVILIGGGLFLIAKATHEIHAEVEAGDAESKAAVLTQSFALVVAQLVAIDLVFSLDSIVTAIGMAQDIEVMVWPRAGDDRDVSRLRPGHRLRRRAPDHQDAGAGVPAADRHGAGGRRLRLPHSARLHLFRHGVRRCG
jgi:predicted tellurium resistance membrane protein TerC